MVARDEPIELRDCFEHEISKAFDTALFEDATDCRAVRRHGKGSRDCFCFLADEESDQFEFVHVCFVLRLAS